MQNESIIGTNAITLFKNKIVYHTLFWVLYFSFFLVIIYGVYQVADPVFYLQLLPFFPVDLAMVYLNLYLLIPRYLGTGKYGRYITGLVIIILAGTAGNLAIKQAYANSGSEIFAAMPAFSLGGITSTVAERFYLLGLTTAIKIGKDWLLARQTMKEKEKEYLQAELKFLKSQIQPHFFFNTLNNLYSLTLQKSDKAPEVVLKLSELMSYTLYQSNASSVALADEINYLENYIDLEKLRFGERLSVHFTVNGSPTDIQITPLLFVFFIENCFKHGPRNTVARACIQIQLTINDGFVTLETENPVTDPPLVSTHGGLGLVNVKRRLELLYKDRYILRAAKNNGIYTSMLKVPI